MVMSIGWRSREVCVQIVCSRREFVMGLVDKQHILVVDDDPHIRQIVRIALERAGYEVSEAEDGLRALEIFNTLGPDLVLLDVLMPELDGIEVCKKLRTTSQVPILFLSSRDDEIDRILGLELGADDYISKPFSPRELIARIKAVLRRVNFEDVSTPAPSEVEDAAEVLIHGELRLDLTRVEAFWGDTQVDLTHTEFGLLRALMGYPGKVYSRGELMQRVWERGTVVSDRTVDSHVRRLRAKFEAVGAAPIETVRGVGYKLGSERGR